MTIKIPQTIKIPILDITVPLWFGISIYVFLVLLYLVVDRAIFLSKVEQTLGTVTQLSSVPGSCGIGRGSDSSTVFSAAVSYIVESENYTVSVSAGESCRGAFRPYSEARYRVGDVVPIVYNRDRPDESYPDNTWDIWDTPIYAFFALLFTLFLGFHKRSSKEPETPDKDIQKPSDSVATDIPANDVGEVPTTETFDKDLKTSGIDNQIQSDSVVSDIPASDIGEVLTTEAFDYKYSYLLMNVVGPVGVALLAGGILYTPGWLVLRLLFSALGVVLIVMSCARTVRVTVSPESFKVSNLLPLHRSRIVLWDDVFDLEIRNEYEDVFIVYITLKDEGDHSRPGAVIKFSSGAVQNFDRLRSILEQRWTNLKNRP